MHFTGKQRDTENLTNPQTLNLYAIVHDNPETFADLDGHCSAFPGAGGQPCSSNGPNPPQKGQPAGNDTTKSSQKKQKPTLLDRAWSWVTHHKAEIGVQTAIAVATFASDGLIGPEFEGLAEGLEGGKAVEEGVEVGAESTEAALPSSESQLGHIFRDAEGHLPDTAGNRELLQSVANDAESILGKDQFGNTWSARALPDGTQVWTETRNGQIINGGLNQTPRVFNPQTGLSGQ